MRAQPKLAMWHTHVNAVQASASMVDWLTNRDSLTERLIAKSTTFRVQRLHQCRALCLYDEFAQLGLVRQQKVKEREVLLRCDENAVVYAHTVMALSANATQWPLFASLGNRSLGSTLFSDPLVERGALQYARLNCSHPLMKRLAALQLLEALPTSLLARRSVFKRKGANLLVTEIFLPSISHLNDYVQIKC